MRCRPRLIRSATIAAATVSAAAAIAACAPQPLSGPQVATPMNRPVGVGGETGSGAVESARRQLTGRWDLLALEVLPPGGGARVPVKASGTLIYDEFGNLTMNARTTDPAAPVAAREKSHLSFSGRAVIDTGRSELKLMDLTGNVNPDEVLSPELRRRFEVGLDTLKLSSFDDQGQVTAVSVWRRQP
jgi:hypothetical protein